MNTQDWAKLQNSARRFSSRLGKRFGVMGVRIQYRWVYYPVPIESPTWQRRDQNRRIDGQA